MGSLYGTQKKSYKELNINHYVARMASYVHIFISIIFLFTSLHFVYHYSILFLTFCLHPTLFLPFKSNLKGCFNSFIYNFLIHYSFKVIKYLHWDRLKHDPNVLSFKLGMMIFIYLYLNIVFFFILGSIFFLMVIQ